ncbi:MAG TPA: biotin transporter BioY [Ktedonobacterales bacterium]|nr:biotin transporter BioY [Ktedonobacterales bacterium]
MQASPANTHPHGSLIDVLTGNSQSAPAAKPQSAKRSHRATALGGLSLLFGGALVTALCLTVDTLSQQGRTTITVAGAHLDARPIVGVSLLVIIGMLAFTRLGLARWLIEALFALGGVALLAASAQLTIHLPFTPVPFTGQTFAVLLIGAAYGWRRGLSAVILYLTVGTIGLPFFAAVVGAASYGYLIGFAVAVVIVGWLAEHGWDRNLFTSILAMLAGEVAIFACGMAWLAQFVGWNNVVADGLIPFLIGDTIKLLAAAVALPLAWFVVGRARGQSAR